MKPDQKVVLLKGNGPISINSELMELYTITTAHGLIGLPLKSLRADNIYIISDFEEFKTIEKEITDRPCCFVYSYEKLEHSDYEKITAGKMTFI